MGEFSTILFVERVIPSAKRIQGRSPEKMKSGYGTPSEGICASPPKIAVKINIIKSGWRIAHAIPSPVCLYRIFMSRIVNVARSSR
jgi:hypothetical protein